MQKLNTKAFVIGTLRKPKIDAVKSVFQDYPYFQGQSIKY